MGLLDEAIRDHLELKRRRGADPSEIARVQREALEPVFPGVHGQGEDGQATERADGEAIAVAYETETVFAPPVEAEYASAEPPIYEQDLDGGAGQPHGETPSEHLPMTVDDHARAFLSQDTVEVDMQAVLDEDVAAAGPTDTPRGDQAATEEDPEFDWETPQRSDVEPPPEPIPGQERLSFE